LRAVFICVGAFVNDLFQIFLDNISPILTIAIIGFVVGKQLRIDPKPLGRVIFYVFSPSLIFDSLSKNHIAPAELAQITLVMVLFVSCMILIAYGVARWRNDNRLDRASIMLAAICPNNGNFGLPLIGFAFDTDVFARAVIVFVTVTFLNYTAGVFIASSGRKSPREALMSILHVPAVYAATAGFIVNSTGFILPPAIQRPIALMGQGAIPCMLILLGLQLAYSTQFSHWKLVSAGAMLRLLVSPVVATILVILLGIHGPASTAVIMQASMPVAVVTIIFASEFGLDDRLVSSTILTSTLLSPFTLSLLILILRQAASIAFFQ
jgi:malate permease and related proteins